MKNINIRQNLPLKDEYTFDFLELGEEHSEKQLEVELINNVGSLKKSSTVLITQI
ncbi:MAG: hypothetical protein ABID79_02250 [Elusimicrobiota bacterium]